MSNDINYSRLMYNNITTHTLHLKYSQLPQSISLIYINALIFGKKCHYYFIYKDQSILYYNDELLRKHYNINESSMKLPKIAEYYKNYLMFFCRPFYRSRYYNNIVQNFGDHKAEIFYRNNFCTSNENNIDKRNNKNNLNNNNVIIFDSKARKSIDDGHILTTIDLCTIHSKNNNNTNYSKSDFLKEEEFFTIKSGRDGLIDMINNLTKNSIHKIKYQDSSENECNCSNSNNNTKSKHEYNNKDSHSKQIKSFSNCNNNYIKCKRITNTNAHSISNNNNNNKAFHIKTSTSPKTSMCNLYKKNNFFGNKSMYNLLITNINNIQTNPKSKSKNQKSSTKENTLINNQYRLYSPKYSSKSNLNQFKKCKPQKIKKNSFKNNITDFLKYKNSFQSSIYNYSLNNNNKPIHINSNSKSSKSKSNRNKISTSPTQSNGMIYLTHCLNQFKNKKENQIKVNKLFSLRSTNNITCTNSNYVNINTKSSNNSKSKQNKKQNNHLLCLNFFNKIPKKSSKNSANTSANILKSNQSVETIFKKKQCAQHLKKESNLIINTNNNSIISNQHSNKKDINLNVNVNLNNIHININTNHNNNNNNNNDLLTHTCSITKNKSQSNINTISNSCIHNNINNNTKHKKHISHTNSNTLLRDGKELHIEMDNVVTGIKSNVNTGRIGDGMLCFSGNNNNNHHYKKVNHGHQSECLLPSGSKSTKGKSSNKKQSSKQVQTQQNQNKNSKKRTGRNTKHNNKSNI